jgi:hypothetical protein
LVAVPAILWPLWHGLGLEMFASVPTGSAPGKGRRGRVGFVLRLACLAIIIGTFVMGTIRTAQQVPLAESAYQKEEALIQTLLSHGATRVYSEYWTCNRLIFHSEERLICAALDEKLGMGFNRYKPYEQILQKTPDPAYVFPENSDQARAFAKSDMGTGGKYQKIVQGGYIIYLPEKA